MSMAEHPATEHTAPVPTPSGAAELGTSLRSPATPIGGGAGFRRSAFGPFNGKSRATARRGLPMCLRLAIFTGALTCLGGQLAWSAPELSGSDTSGHYKTSMDRTSISHDAAVKAPTPGYSGKATTPDSNARKIDSANAANPPGMPLLPANVTDLAGAKKVINVAGLTLPPLSQPLPQWMQAASVRVDKLDRTGLPIPAQQDGPSKGTRLAQDPTAPPVREPSEPVTNSDRLPNQIEVAVSTFVVLLTTSDLQTVAVADPSIADVAVVNSRSVLLNGKTAGVTSLVIVDKNKIRQYSVRVTSAPGTRPVDVAAAIGLPGVSVRPLRDALILEGEVASAEEARRAVEVAGIYSPKVINQLTIRGAISSDAELANRVKDLLSGYPTVVVKTTGDTVILTGTADTPAQLSDIDTIAKAAGKDIKVIDLIKLPTLTPEQVRATLGAASGAPGAAPAIPTGIAGSLTTPTPLTVTQVGDQLILSGLVASQAEADTAMTAAARTGLQVVNRMQILPATPENQNFVSLVASAIGRPGVIVRGTPKRIVLEGQVPDTNAAVAAEQVARGFAVQVDNLLMTPKPQSVDVDVSIVEITKTGLKNLGVHWAEGATTAENIATTTDANNVTTRTVTRTIDPTVFNEGQITEGNGFAGFGGFSTFNPIRARLNALYTSGDAKLLSNPRTTVLSGRTATFQVGGQIAIPQGSTTNGSGTSVSIQFKDYGILIDVVPVVCDDGTVTLRVRSEVSQPDFANATTISGTVIPAFSRRASVTEVTVPKGGMVSLGGLITSTIQMNVNKIPLLGSIPVLGALFSSKRFQHDESELVVFVSPTVLPNPLKAGELAPASPFAVGENTNAATVLGNPGIGSFNTGKAINTVSSVGSGGSASQ